MDAFFGSEFIGQILLATLLDRFVIGLIGFAGAGECFSGIVNTVQALAGKPGQGNRIGICFRKEQDGRAG